MAAILLSVQFAVQVIDEDLRHSWWVRLFFNICTITLSIILIMSLRVLKREQQKEKFEGIENDSRLVRAHSVTFILAAIVDFIAFIFITLTGTQA